MKVGVIELRYIIKIQPITKITCFLRLIYLTFSSYIEKITIKNYSMTQFAFTQTKTI